MTNNDIVLEKMLKEKVPLTQRNYITLAFWDKRSIEELGAEERADLPDGFEDWPEDEGRINGCTLTNS